MQPGPRPLLSIVVPTRNRAHTASHLAGVLLALPEPDIEVVVRDCSDDDALERALKPLAEPRLVYARGPATNMTDNWNRALPLISGRYVSFIGDDDGFMPWTLKVLRELTAAGPIDALIGEGMIAYAWPDFPDAGAGTLQFARYAKNPSVAVRKVGPALDRLVAFSRTDQPVPRLYYGVVRREKLAEIADAEGRCFRTAIPDWYAMIRLAGIIAEVHVLDRPVAVVGRSRSSNSGRVLSDKSFRHHLKEFGLERPDWDPYIPLVGTLEVQFGEPIVRALRDTGDARRLALFRRRYVPQMYAFSLLRNPRQAGAILSRLARNVMPDASPRERTAIAAGVLAHAARRVGERGLAALGRRKPSPFPVTLAGVPSIGAAIALVERHTGGAG